MVDWTPPLPPLVMKKNRHIQSVNNGKAELFCACYGCQDSGNDTIKKLEQLDYLVDNMIKALLSVFLVLAFLRWITPNRI